MRNERFLNMKPCLVELYQCKHDRAKTKRIFRRICADMQWSDDLARRAEIADYIKKLAVNGQIQVVESGMDCDCTSYTYARLIPATLQHYMRFRDDCYEHAEGPCNVMIESPDVKVATESRDLALEAFENGHPHVVYYS